MTIERRRFIVEATPEYWAVFHDWYKRVRPDKNKNVRSISGHAVSGKSKRGGDTNFQRHLIHVVSVHSS